MDEYKEVSDLFENISIENITSLKLPNPALLDYYEDMANRVVWIDSEIDDGTLDIVSKIIHWNRLDKDIPIKDRVPIKIFFNSPGGSLDAADTIVSMIELSKTPIYGIGIGVVASAASIIFLACHKRFALKNTYLVVHRGSCENIGANYNELMAAMDDYRHQVEKMEIYYINHTKYTEEEIKKNIATDWYIRGDELIDKEIIHGWIQSIDELM